MSVSWGHRANVSSKKGRCLAALNLPSALLKPYLAHLNPLRHWRSQWSPSADGNSFPRCAMAFHFVVAVELCFGGKHLGFPQDLCIHACWIFQIQSMRRRLVCIYCKILKGFVCSNDAGLCRFLQHVLRGTTLQHYIQKMIHNVFLLCRTRTVNVSTLDFQIRFILQLFWQRRFLREDGLFSCFMCTTPPIDSFSFTFSTSNMHSQSLGRTFFVVFF